jgi:HEAT repeat protein
MLGFLHDASAVLPLRKLLDRDSEKVREAAYGALESLEGAD